MKQQQCHALAALLATAIQCFDCKFRDRLDSDTLQLGKLCDFQVQLDNSERVPIVAERMRDGIAGD